MFYNDILIFTIKNYSGYGQPYTYTLNENIGSFYLFYAVVVLFTLTFLYVYRFQMNEKYYLYWGIALLYLMGLESCSLSKFEQ